MQKGNNKLDLRLLIPVLIIDRIIKCIPVSGAVINSDNVAIRGIFIIISILLITLLKIILTIPDRFRWLEMLVIGGLSNLFDIIVFGGVLDNMHMFGFYQNFSDILISAGIIFLILELIKWKK